MKHLHELGTRRYSPDLKMYTGLPGIPAAVALLNILFMMVLFFARSGNYTPLSGFRVDVPRVKTAIRENIQLLHENVVTVMPTEKKGKKFEIFFRNRPLELADLPAELQKMLLPERKGKDKTPRKKSDMTVIVMIDRTISFGHVAPVLAAIGNAGFKCYLPVMPQNEQKDQSFEP